WIITQAFIIAETLLAAFLVERHKVDIDPWPRFFAAAVGALVAVTWFCALRRSARYHEFRIYQARGLERQLNLSTFIDGEPFAKGRPVVAEGGSYGQTRRAECA